MAMTSSSRSSLIRPTRVGRRVVFVAIIALMGIVSIGCGEAADENDSATTDVPATQPTTPTESTEIAPAPSSSVPVVEPSDVVSADDEFIWPFSGSADSYDDPVALVTAFASEYLGFTKLVVGGFEADGDDAGAVAVRSFENGTPTVVRVARAGDGDGWGVLGASNENLILESPGQNATIDSPVTVSGQSTAFEGTIDIMVREYGRLDPLVRDFATGGANGEMGPFTKQLDLAEGGADHGAVIVWTTSMEDGGTQEATVVRIVFG